MEAINFEAILYKAQTTVDGGWRVTLDIAHSDAAKVLDLTKFRQEVFQVAMVPFAKEDEFATHG